MFRVRKVYVLGGESYAFGLQKTVFWKVKDIPFGSDEWKVMSEKDKKDPQPPNLGG